MQWYFVLPLISGVIALNFVVISCGTVPSEQVVTTSTPTTGAESVSGLENTKDAGKVVETPTKTRPLPSATSTKTTKPEETASPQSTATPPNATASGSMVSLASVEYVRYYLTQLDSAGAPRTVPHIAVGDVTGDGKTEILFALEGGDRMAQHEEGVFWRHPVTLSWNGETFEETTALWTGIPAPAPSLSVAERQGLPYAVAIVDLDRDGTNEILVGTDRYRNPSEYGAFYIFEWDGKEFEAKYADYCIGSVDRLDVLGNGAGVAVSGWDRPLSGNAKHEGVCPQVWQDSSEPRATLFLLTSEGPDEYQLRPLVSDQKEWPSLVLNPQNPLITQFVWFRSDGWSWFWQDWATATSYNLNGQPIRNIVAPQTGYLGIHSTAADLDGDGVDEMVTLGGDYSASGDVYVWQIFHMSDGEYRMVFESREKLVHTGYFVTGDIDGNGREEIVDVLGRLYVWNGSRLCFQGNVIEAAGLQLQRGLEEIFIGDVYGNGQSRLVFTAHPAENSHTPDDRALLYPAMYVVKVELPPAGGACLDE